MKKIKKEMPMMIDSDKCCGEKEQRDSTEGFPSEGWGACYLRIEWKL